MTKHNFWLVAILTGGLLSGSLLAPLAGVQAAPAEQASAQVMINVNKANQTELETVRGIGPLLAERIVKDRETNGSFKSAEDLVRVPGIGKAKFEKIKSQVTV